MSPAALAANVNAKTKLGATPLHMAAARGHTGIVERLIAKGADVNVKNDHGVTPLRIARDTATKS